jgi:chemotaxis protein methyltransferase CheR
MVSDVVASRMGLHFPTERWTTLSRNLIYAAKESGFQNMDGFIQWLLHSEPGKDQIKILASHLTISETYFWREPKVFAALTDSILPELYQSKKNKEKCIRIWSAGCSTGEEAYSIAIALHKTIKKIEDWKITILATDINPAALGKAEHGIYRNWSFRNCPDWLKTRYFNDLGDRRFEIIPEIKKMVTFQYRSLTDENTLPAIANKMDIIFCRNVLMYFTSDWVSKISQGLFNSLSENGWFVVSSSELSSQLFPQFTAVNFPGAVLYCKGKNGNTHSFDVHSIAMLEPLQPLNILTHFKPQPQPQPQPQPIQQHPAEESIIAKIFAIRLLADQGHLEEALTICNEAIESCKLAPEIYFLRASILQELDKDPEAIKSLKQAIYIDPEYVMGHFALGNLFIRQGNSKNSKMHFKNTLDLLNGCADEDILPESDGLSVKHIREIIFANMEKQQ